MRLGRTRGGAAFIAVLFASVFSVAGAAGILKAPFKPQDVLPLLPHSISWPVLKSLNNTLDILPQFVGAVTEILKKGSVKAQTPSPSSHDL
ncbi:hypothetical protein R1flu_024485 [Riccia fluitans]|uniref:Uncharacterized protein n=1 Tax=Riccia fluitans TaxID=41844 RepID=A0ABD1XZ51_9MARC